MILSYEWYASFQDAKNKKAGARRNRNYGRNIGCVHVCTWFIGLVAAMVAWQGGRDNDSIEGDSLIGMCFISSKSTTWFILLVTLPVFVMLVVLILNCYCSFKTISGVLNTVKTQGLKDHVRKIRLHRLRIILFVVPLAISIVIFLVVSSYDMTYLNEYEQSLKTFLISKMKQSIVKQENYLVLDSANSSEYLAPIIRQSPWMVLLKAMIQQICFLIISTLAWTRAGFYNWIRLGMKLFEILIDTHNKNGNDIEMCPTNKDGDKGKAEDGDEEIPKVKKLQLMAQAWAKRYDVAETGKLSFTFPSDNDSLDGNNKNAKQSQPVVVGILESIGQSVDLGEASEFQSVTEFKEFALALPRLVQRRNGCSGAFNLGLKAWGSVDSNLHLSRTVSIRSSRMGGYSFNSKRSSYVGSQNGNADSQQSAYQSEFSEYLYSLHRDSFLRSRTSGKAIRFIKRFSQRSKKSSNISSKGTSAQPSVDSDDNDVTILPAITRHPKSHRPVDQATVEYSKTQSLNHKLEEIKSRLEDKQSKVPGPGNSINIGILSKINQSKQTDSGLSYKRPSPNKNIASSIETYLSEEESDRNKIQKNDVKETNYKCEQVAVQTSLTDLSELCKRPIMTDKATQHNNPDTFMNAESLQPQTFIVHANSTTSSSQTETNAFLPKILQGGSETRMKDGQHVNANVVKIRLRSNENDDDSSNGFQTRPATKSSLSAESSSIPSSYGKQSNAIITTVSLNVDTENYPQTTEKVFANQPELRDEKNLLQNSSKEDIPALKRPFTMPVLSSSSPSHNRGRRGGILPKEVDAVAHAAASLSKPRHPVLTLPTKQTPSDPFFENLGPSPSLVTYSNTLDELELKSRIPSNDGSFINAQLQSMPDSIIRVSISTPSS